MGTDDRERLLLKVMRLAQPSVEHSIWPYLDVGHTEQNSTSNILQDPVTRSASLLLPLTQGQVFGGEVFNAYIHIGNTSVEEVQNVVAQVTMVFGSAKLLLFNNESTPNARLKPGGYFDFTISQPLTDLGTYTLVCSITYLASGERFSFKKSFKFAAQCPFKISHRIARIPGKVLVECILENHGKQRVLLSSAKLRAEGVTFEMLKNRTSMDEHGIYLFSPQSSYSMLFLMDNTASSIPSTNNNENIGSLSLQWKTSSGGLGELDRLPLVDAQPREQPIDLIVVSCPASTKVDTPFEIELKVVNHMEKAAQLVLSINKKQMEPFFIKGPSSQQLGEVATRTSITVSIEVLCLNQGCHLLQGIQVLDLNTLWSTNGSALCGVLVI